MTVLQSFRAHADDAAIDGAQIDVHRVRVEALADAWTDAERDATEALRCWQAANADAWAAAHVVYVAALDREQQAALVLSAALEACR